MTILTIGEAMLRLSVRPGDHIGSASAFEVHVAGAEANVAVALAGLGRSVGWFSALPDNALGRRVARTLVAAGVDTSTVLWRSGARLGTYFVELSSPPRPTRVIYDRAHSAASSLTPDDVPWEIVARADAVHISGITPALSDGCRELAMEVARRVKEGGALFSVDVNYRAQLWSVAEAAACLEELVDGAGLVLCSREDARDVFGVDGGAGEVAARLADRFQASRLVLTDGEAGAHWRAGDDHGHVPAIPATVVDRLGAGDALAAGVIDGILDGDLELGVHRGVVMAALALGTRGDQVTTWRQEVDSLVRGEGRRLDR